MINITFIGDVMLGRMIGSKYDKQPYEVVSKELQDICSLSDVVIANLESPVTITKDTDVDHLQFIGNENILSSFKWINVFSLANNHINDASSVGMSETVQLLERNGFKHNGLFTRDGEYFPFVCDTGNQKIAVFTLTDMVNIPFAEDCKWQCLRVGETRVNELISNFKQNGFCVIVFAHIGALFTRYPNPSTVDFLHSYVDSGADCIVTAHSHCLGGMEIYNNIPIFHSIGDFVMDGNSFRRRRSAILSLSIDEGKVKKWELSPAEINDDYQTVRPSKKVQASMLKSFDKVTCQISAHMHNYCTFYKWQYKVEMLSHTISTILYLIHKKGFFGMLRLVYIRIEEVLRMFKWIATDRSKVQRDDDAILPDRKKFKQEEIFK